MASVSAEHGDGKLNTDLNLVPFIDLLSTLTLFLLVTAVWLQVAAIPASVQSKGKSHATVAPEKRLTIHLTQGGYQMSWPSALGRSPFPSSLAKKAGQYDAERLMSGLKLALQKNKALSVAVSAEDGIDYGWVVEALDAAKASGVLAVGLSTN